ncbi:Nitric oxide reductase activation protein NorE [hydrothermal vent metagenome]|uniref:Nitric oxide reductase activation protein NorE n=1 Tax=hydrothermal vent metagenome TaxID=652676 RepID=A0A3B0STL9_9ZZZZ
MHNTNPAPSDISSQDDWGALSRLPGNPMMWVLIWSELVVFGIFFIGFTIAHALQPEVFMQSQDSLNRFLGGINTMVLVTSGLCAALAVTAQHEGKTSQMRLWIGGAVVLGCVFLWVKYLEYAEKYAQGIGLETNTFYTLYFLLTGFHAFHVVFGIIILIIVGWKNNNENLEIGATFWHMVDLIWIILFPLIYLLR